MMKHIVSFETAVRLECAGFPQPNLSFLQRWCTKIDAETFERHIIGFPGDKFYIYADSFNTSNICFMPTATDILEQLPGWNLAYTKVFGWIVYWDAPGLAEPIQFRHDNPAEAASLAWLHEIEVRVTDERRTGPPNAVVTVSFYDDIADKELVCVVDLAASQMIENALTDMKNCPVCDTRANADTMPYDEFRQTVGWENAMRDGGMLRKTSEINDIHCWKCPSCKHIWI